MADDVSKSNVPLSEVTNVMTDQSPKKDKKKPVAVVKPRVIETKTNDRPQVRPNPEDEQRTPPTVANAHTQVRPFPARRRPVSPPAVANAHTQVRPFPARRRPVSPPTVANAHTQVRPFPARRWPTSSPIPNLRTFFEIFGRGNTYLHASNWRVPPLSVFLNSSSSQFLRLLVNLRQIPPATPEIPSAEQSVEPDDLKNVLIYMRSMVEAGQMTYLWRMSDDLIHRAAEDGRTDVIESLLALGANPNGQREDGWTPLHCAAAKGNSSAARALMEGGAFLNVRSNEGKTAAYYASENGHLELADVLHEDT